MIITNARIIDGTGNPWFHGAIGVDDGKIVQVGDLTEYTSDELIDAEQQIVAPGFIDVHAHIESSIFRRPDAENFIRDGVTSLVTGNCGSSSTDMTGFFQELRDTGIALNIAALIGHNSVRRAVMGAENRTPTATELDSMKLLVRSAMKAGAVGFSTGLIYVPGTYSETEEVVELAKVAGEHGGIYASHMRNEGKNIADAIAEAVNIGREANLPVEISHFKVSGKPMWNKSNMTIDLVRTYREDGLDVTVDQYPYTASSTTLAVILPSWSLAGGTDSLSARLENEELKSQIISEMKEELTEAEQDDYEYCAVSNCPWQKSYNGKRIPEVTEMRTGSRSLESQIETILVMVARGDRVQMVFHSMNEDDVRHILRSPFTMIASDAGIPQFGYNVPHPRAYGTNARVLGRYVREQKVISWEDAIRKMTSLPASRFKLHNRGLIKKGLAADLVIFDPETVSDRATFEEPHAYSTGFSHVVVNGKSVIKAGESTGMRSGIILENRNE